MVDYNAPEPGAQFTSRLVRVSRATVLCESAVGIDQTTESAEDHRPRFCARTKKTHYA